MKAMVSIMLLSIGLASLHGQKPHGLVVKDSGKICLADPVNETYMIRTRNNRIYLPLTLDKKFRQNGLKVTFEGTIDTASLKNVRLAGFPITIEKMKKQ